MVVGLTGMSGAGKSYVAEHFSSAGFNIIDADKTYHELVSRDGECTRELKSAFGTSVINRDGSLDRSALAPIVFSDPAKLALLNSITHRYVLSAIRQEISRRAGICVVDAPQLFESGFDAECEVIVGVVADPALCVERIVSRDKISPEKAKQRLANQHGRDYIESRCDVVIINNGNDISKDIENTIKMIKEKTNV
ncbi:MAG: dephospho-CoA kinase [Clostridia bacterium]|nr:dephospho-CoA kinase [Clostridia bacterium]